ncbi:MAG TPA: CcmD family protein [Coriobacteriia bacterium]|nr:CcmD family protein [Coriobacteriia bacterium]
MDPVLTEIYKTVLGAAPYVLAAYALLWIGLMGYVALGIRRVSALEKELTILEEAVARRS